VKNTCPLLEKPFGKGSTGGGGNPRPPALMMGEKKKVVNSRKTHLTVLKEIIRATGAECGNGEKKAKKRGDHIKGDLVWLGDGKASPVTGLKQDLTGSRVIQEGPD